MTIIPALDMNVAGEPDGGNPLVRFDEGSGGSKGSPWSTLLVKNLN